jgi:hypothetical protein
VAAEGSVDILSCEDSPHGMIEHLQWNVRRFFADEEIGEPKL